MSKIFYIHLGYPKTGTTYLQQHVFPNINNLHYFGKPFSRKNKNLRKIFETIIASDKEKFSKIKKKLVLELSEIIEDIKYKKILISFEPFLDPNYYLKNNKLINFENIISNLNRVFGIFGKINYIITLRNYNDLIEKYFYEVYHKLNFDYTEFNFHQNLRKKSYKNIFLLENFFYSKKINFIKKNCNKHIVLFYEDLKFNKNFFFKQILFFLGLKDQKLNFKNIPLNLSLKKQKLFGIIYFFEQMKNFFQIKILKKLWSNKFNLKSYIKVYEKFLYELNRIIVTNRLKKFKFRENKNLIIEFYKNDLESLPKNLKIKCIHYKYLQ